MDRRKIYCYHTLTPIDIFDSIEWAREHYDFYDGETSPLWNEHVQKEFARIKAERQKATNSLQLTFDFDGKVIEYVEDFEEIS